MRITASSSGKTAVEFTITSVPFGEICLNSTWVCNWYSWVEHLIKGGEWNLSCSLCSPAHLYPQLLTSEQHHGSQGFQVLHVPLFVFVLFFFFRDFNHHLMVICVSTGVISADDARHVPDRIACPNKIWKLCQFVHLLHILFC